MLGALYLDQASTQVDALGVREPLQQLLLRLPGTGVRARFLAEFDQSGADPDHIAFGAEPVSAQLWNAEMIC